MRNIKPRVVVVESESLLVEGIESLLRQADELEITDVAYTNAAAFLQNISDARPDAILLEMNGPLDSRQILTMLASLPALAALRVIVVRPDDNNIEVFERRRVLARRSADLINTIRRVRH
jgi:DNA-binding NarL/FixJ family response regulator